MADYIAIIEANKLAFALALVIGLLVAWWLYGRRSARTRKRHQAPDALDQDAAPAARNQSLIDAPSAVAVAKAAMPEALREPVPIAAPPPPSPPVAAPLPQAPEPVPPVPKAKATPKAKTAPKAKAEPRPKAALRPKASPKPKAAAKPKAAPKPVAAPLAPSRPSPAAAVEVIAPPPAPPAGGPEELARIKGLGPKLQSLLPALGVTTLAQIAAWDDAEIDRIDAQLGVFAGRIRKDSWVDQAKFLALGDTAGFEGKFGKL